MVAGADTRSKDHVDIFTDIAVTPHLVVCRRMIIVIILVKCRKSEALFSVLISETIRTTSSMGIAESSDVQQSGHPETPPP